MTDTLSIDLAMLRRQAERQAYSLGIALYVTADGRISQLGPGERIDPPRGAVPTAHGHGKYATPQSQP